MARCRPYWSSEVREGLVKSNLAELRIELGNIGLGSERATDWATKAVDECSVAASTREHDWCRDQVVIEVSDTKKDPLFCSKLE